RRRLPARSPRDLDPPKGPARSARAASFPPPPSRAERYTSERSREGSVPGKLRRSMGPRVDRSRARHAALAFLLLGPPVAAQTPATLSASPPGAGVAFVDGTVFEDHFGVSVSGGGDFNGDGYPDLLVGGSFAHNGSGVQTGAAAVIYGGPSMAGSTYLGASTPGSVYFVGSNAGDLAAWAVSFVGDANGDGYDD